MSIQLINTELCSGCRICELACSFHRKGVFSPELSSITISSNNRTCEIEWSISSTCDSCGNEASPLCVKYCMHGALKEVK